MAEETAKPTGPNKAGFDGPIKEPAGGKLPDHIHPDTLMAKGVDPDTKEIVTVNMAALQAKYGDKAKDLYVKIAKAGGFFDPSFEPVGGSFFPDISLDGLDPKIKTQIDKLLKEA